MFARLILALLLAAFALPALANGPCHDAPTAAMAVRGHHHQPTPDERATVPHVCIGCIPPASLASRTLAAPTMHAVILGRAVPVRFDRLAALPPAVPPPRLAA